MHDLWVITTSPAVFEILYINIANKKDRAQMTDLIVKLFAFNQCVSVRFYNNSMGRYGEVKVSV
ncbi:ANE_G0004900.mRNA.1.CDS.1 [Saccharomyces cerevisiae]|nr:ANE_G0004900.mRNA.1.CDS.1 [Saccharomyces cerevisiae]CAI6511081.1 ANE_G0004900.mRNA.1.CDS.1 [Saccharomyces cerevisiae]